MPGSSVGRASVTQKKTLTEGHGFESHSGYIYFLFFHLFIYFILLFYILLFFKNY